MAQPMEGLLADHGVLIFALNTTEDHKEYLNIQATLRWHGLEADRLVRAEGFYGGEIEASYIFPYSAEAERVVRDLTKEHNQESILFIDGDGEVTLIYLDSIFQRPYVDEYLGKIEEVTCSEAHTLGAYTRLGHSYYAVKE